MGGAVLEVLGGFLPSPFPGPLTPRNAGAWEGDTAPASRASGQGGAGPGALGDQGECESRCPTSIPRGPVGTSRCPRLGYFPFLFPPCW